MSPTNLLRFGAAVAALAVAAGPFALAPAAHAAQKAKSAAGKGIAWQSDLAKAQKQAAKEKKLVMLDFGAEWCGPCKQMLATTYKDKAVVDKAKGFVPVLIDIDKQKAVAEKYKIEAVPTVLFLDSKGKVLDRHLGYRAAPEFSKLMDEARKKAKS